MSILNANKKKNNPHILLIVLSLVLKIEFNIDISKMNIIEKSMIPSIKMNNSKQKNLEKIVNFKAYGVNTEIKKPKAKGLRVSTSNPLKKKLCFLLIL